MQERLVGFGVLRVVDNAPQCTLEVGELLPPMIMLMGHEGNVENTIIKQLKII